jgi:hypothetical protein
VLEDPIAVEVEKYRLENRAKSQLRAYRCETQQSSTRFSFLKRGNGIGKNLITERVGNLLPDKNQRSSLKNVSKMDGPAENTSY